MTYSRIGDRIQQLLESEKISRLKLSKETGIPYSTITQIINGRTKDPQFSSLEKIADYFEVTVDYLRGESLFAVIEKRLKELNMTTKEFSKLTELPEDFILGIDSWPPAPEDYEPGEMIEKFAKILNMDFKTLANAFSRQERSGDNKPSLSSKDFSGKIEEDSAIDLPKKVGATYDDEDWTEEELKEIERFKEFLRSKRRQQD